MRVTWVLLAFAILWLLVGIAMSPAHSLIGPLDEFIWDGLMLRSIAILTVLAYPAAPIARALGVSDIAVMEAMLLAVALAIAGWALSRLARKDVSAGSKAGYTLLLMLALSVPAGVLLTLHEISKFGR